MQRAMQPATMRATWLGTRSRNSQEMQMQTLIKTWRVEALLESWPQSQETTRELALLLGHCHHCSPSCCSRRFCDYSQQQLTCLGAQSSGRSAAGAACLPGPPRMTLGTLHLCSHRARPPPSRWNYHRYPNWALLNVPADPDPCQDPPRMATFQGAFDAPGCCPPHRGYFLPAGYGSPPACRGVPFESPRAPRRQHLHQHRQEEHDQRHRPCLPRNSKLAVVSHTLPWLQSLQKLTDV
mmetsp:Transcript_152149/g.276757  ORF Transcript_152149/g.276757 Transcript_152149/m.276757 type:complete len:238 (+) Transcript_152149:506-1219(+)